MIICYNFYANFKYCTKKITEHKVKGRVHFWSMSPYVSEQATSRRAFLTSTCPPFPFQRPFRALKGYFGTTASNIRFGIISNRLEYQIK